ncbi:MAG: suppressor of fused domain protein [Saprospiraceae bacterium]|nr:suppressor of fused domain protein [Saprospiraceae bacterium]
MNWWKKILGRKDLVFDPVAEFPIGDEQMDQYYEWKKAGLEKQLGPMQDKFDHAIIPFVLGGAVDVYCFPKAKGGTALSTMELIHPDGSGPVPNELGTYELVAFTRHKPKAKQAEDSAFTVMERKISSLLSIIAQHSFLSSLEPGETAEVPNEDGNSHYLVFDKYQARRRPFRIGNHDHGLLLIMEVHKSELKYARKYGTHKLIEKLKQAKVYPCSDLDREPVI